MTAGARGGAVRTGLLAAACLLAALGLWQLARYGVFARLEAPPGDRLPAMAIPPPPPDETAHVALLGASLFHRGSWAQTLADRLSACRPASVMVHKVTLPGASSAWGRGQVERVLAVAGAARVPDAVVISLSVNDASLWRGVPLAESRANHAALIAAFRARGVAVYLATMSPAYSALWPAPITKGLVRPGQASYKALYRVLARQTGAGLIDDAPRWRALERAELRAAMPDGLHPTNAAMVRVAVPAFADVLSARFCPQAPRRVEPQ